MTPIKNETSDVFLGHFGELFREEGFEADEPDEIVRGVIVVYYDTFDGGVGVRGLWWRGGGGRFVGGFIDVVAFDVGGYGRVRLSGGIGWHGFFDVIVFFRWSGRLLALP